MVASGGGPAPTEQDDPEEMMMSDDPAKEAERELESLDRTRFNEVTIPTAEAVVNSWFPREGEGFFPPLAVTHFIDAYVVARHVISSQSFIPANVPSTLCGFNVPRQFKPLRTAENRLEMMYVVRFELVYCHDSWSFVF